MSDFYPVPGDAPKPTDHRKGKKGRPHALDDPAYAKLVAEAFAAGLSRQKMADMFNIKDLATITRWRRDPRVKAEVWRLTEDRILQVTRKVDAVIVNRLEDADEMSVQELLAIRKEFLGGSLRDKTQNVDEGDINAAHELLEKDPGMIEKFQELFGSGDGS